MTYHLGSWPVSQLAAFLLWATLLALDYPKQVSVLELNRVLLLECPPISLIKKQKFKSPNLLEEYCGQCLDRLDSPAGRHHACPLPPSLLHFRLLYVFQ